MSWGQDQNCHNYDILAFITIQLILINYGFTIYNYEEQINDNVSCYEQKREMSNHKVTANSKSYLWSFFFIHCPETEYTEYFPAQSGPIYNYRPILFIYRRSNMSLDMAFDPLYIFSFILCFLLKIY